MGPFTKSDLMWELLSLQNKIVANEEEAAFFNRIADEAPFLGKASGVPRQTANAVRHARRRRLHKLIKAMPNYVQPCSEED